MAICEACGKEIYFLKTKNGKLMPVNAETMTSVELRDAQENLTRLFVYGRHISHFSDCPKAEKFRK